MKNHGSLAASPVSVVMPDPDRSLALSEVRVNALSRWDNEGGATAAIAQDLQADLETETGSHQRDTSSRPSKAKALENAHLSNGPL